VVASLVQLADYGFRLRVKLFTFREAMYSANKSIRTVSIDVSLTSTVLNSSAKYSRLIRLIMSDRVIDAANQTVVECLAIFEELYKALEKSMGNLGALDRDGRKELTGVRSRLSG
jgi:hypothetical protein